MNCMEIRGGHGSTENYFRRPGLDLWIWSFSSGRAESCGGDLHLLSSCASGRITRMLLADVCGHGPLFADIAGELRELIKQNVNSVKHGRIVRKMSRGLETASLRGCYASTLISTYFAPTSSLTICNAGHPPPLLFRSERREWSVLKQAPTDVAAGGSPLGVVEPVEYQQFKTELKVGDMVLSYSKTFTECRGADGGVLGLAGLLSRARQLDLEQPLDLAAQLATQIRNEHADNLATEDATMLVCRATATRVAWRDNILAPFRLLRAVCDKTKFAPLAV